MKTKEKTGERILRFPRRDTVGLSRRAFVGAAESGVGFLLGAVLAGAEIFGRYSPFGVAAVAAAGSGITGFCTLAGSCLGYLCLEGIDEGMRYAASSILIYSVAFAFYDIKIYRSAWFMPAVAAGLSAVTGLICRGGVGWHGEDLVYFVTEVLFTAAAAYCYTIMFAQWPDVLDGWEGLSSRQGMGVLVLAGTVLMALARVELLQTFSLGRLLAALVVLQAARGGAGTGVLAGASAGISLDLASGQPPYYSMIFSVAGLACGLCRNKPRLVIGAVYFAASTAAVLWTWNGELRVGMLLEAATGVILFLMLPKRRAAKEALPALPQPGEDLESAKQTVSRKMGAMAEAFHALSDQLRQTLRPEDRGSENPAEIFTRTADQVCHRCALRGTCWQKDYEHTRGTCNDATKPILERGRALPTDFPGQFSERCIRFTDFISTVNRELTAFLRRRQMLRRTWENRRALCGQYAQLDHLMQGVAAECAASLTPDLPRQEKLRGFLKSMNVEGGMVYYDKEGRLQVETPDAAPLRARSARRELTEVLGVPLREPETRRGWLIFAQAEPLRAVAALAGEARSGEKVSGDKGTWFRREDGMLFFLLCDGMGSGPAARQESTQTAGLIERFLRAGLAPEQALETVSGALALRGGDRGSTSVDLLAVDLFSGRTEIYKQGAAPTYLCRQQQVKCAAGSAIPAGLLTGPAAKPEVHRFRSNPGDWMILITDGILCGREDDWLRELLSHCDSSSPSELAGRIMRESQLKTQGEDDGTVLAIRLERGKDNGPW